ncbi:MAG: RNA polymerase sigma factor, partial [Acidimicrobiales bacterium]
MTIQETRPRPTSVYALDIGVSACDRDRQLVLGFLAGDVDAFAVIAQEHYRALAAQARRLLGPSGQPEDAVQETLERAMRGLKRFGLTGEYRLGPWLGRILANVCNDQRARASRQYQLVQNAAARPSLEDDVADRIGDPKTIDAVRSALLELPQTHRRALVLHELEGLPYA